jgi:hypothetical protein
LPAANMAGVARMLTVIDPFGNTLRFNEYE